VVFSPQKSGVLSVALAAAVALVLLVALVALVAFVAGAACGQVFTHIVVILSP
jgi:hypothetical protein